MLIGVDSVKENLVTKLSIRERGAGFTHFPCGPDGEERAGATTEFFKSLCAEQRVLKFVDGFPKYAWTKKAHQGNDLGIPLFMRMLPLIRATST
jgi:phage terminase large subunit GpA-like protein